jgi:hypothetical protein
MVVVHISRTSVLLTRGKKGAIMKAELGGSEGHE